MKATLNRTVLRNPEMLAQEIWDDVLAPKEEIVEAIRQAIALAKEDARDECVSALNIYAKVIERGRMPDRGAVQALRSAAKSIELDAEFSQNDDDGEE